MVILMVLIHLALSFGLQGHQKEIAAWLGEKSGHTVQFDTMQTSWTDGISGLTLTNLRFFSSSSDDTPVLRVGTVHVRINPLRSVLHRALIPDTIDISNLQLHLVREHTGGWFMAGNRRRHSSTEAHNMVPTDWMNHGTELNLRDMTVLLSDTRHGMEALPVTVVEADLRHFRGQRRIEATIRPPPEYGDALSLSLMLDGQFLGADWNAQLHLDWHRPRWPANDSYPSFQQEAGKIQVQARWEKAMLHTVTVRLNADALQIANHEATLDIHKAELHASAVRKASGDWQVQLQTEHFVTDNGPWSPAQYQLLLSSATGQRHYTAKLEYLKLQDSLLALRLLSLPEPVFASDYHLAGVLRDTDLIWGGGAPTQFVSHFSSLNLAHPEEGAYIHGLAGEVYYRGEDRTGTMALRCQNQVQFALPRHLGGRKTLDCLKGNLKWHSDEEATRINLDAIEAKDSTGATASMSGSLDIGKDTDAAHAKLRAEVTTLPLSRLHTWIPNRLGTRFKHWAAAAFRAGRIEQAKLMLEGDLKQFPFPPNQGKLQARLDLSGAEVKYHPNWPAITGLNATLVADNNQLTITGHRGDMYGVVIQDGMRLSVDSLRTAPLDLRIEGTLAGRLHDAQQFLHHTSLGKTPTLAGLTGVSINGDARLKLALLLPLSSREREKELRGQLLLKDVEVSDASALFSLQGLQGTLHFAGTEVYSEDMVAEYRKRPVSIHIDLGRKKLPHYVLSGKMDTALLQDEAARLHPWAVKAARWLEGESLWQIEATRGADNDRTWHLRLHSDLRGTSLSLPAPLGKAASPRRRLSLTTVLHDHTVDHIDIDYEGLFTAAVIPGKPDRTPPGISIGLQEAAPPVQTGNLLIRGSMAELDIKDWFDWQLPKAPRRADSTAQSGNTMAGMKINADVSIDHMMFAGLDLGRFAAHLADEVALLRAAPCHGELQALTAALAAVESLYLALCNEDMQGIVQMFKEQDETKFRVALRDLHVLSNGKGSTDWMPDIDLDRVPEIQLSVEDLRWNKESLGQLSLALRGHREGLDVTEFDLDGPSVRGFGQGHWRKGVVPESSNLDLVLKGETLNALLQALGYQKMAIDKGAARIEIEVEWAGAPTDFSLQNLDGQLQIVIRKGHLQDVDTAVASRIFGLLNFDSLLRRLTLDFSDLFGKGLAFDRITGNFSLHQGQARIGTLRLTGPSAQVDIEGSIDLQHKRYDQTAIVSPNLSHKLPWIGAIFSGPVGIGVGALYYLDNKFTKILPNPMDNILSMQYRIIGPWDNPDITRVRNAENASEAAPKNRQQPSRVLNE